MLLLLLSLFTSFDASDTAATADTAAIAAVAASAGTDVDVDATVAITWQLNDEEETRVWSPSKSIQARLSKSWAVEE